MVLKLSDHCIEWYLSTQLHFCMCMWLTIYNENDILLFKHATNEPHTVSSSLLFSLTSSKRSKEWILHPVCSVCWVIIIIKLLVSRWYCDVHVYTSPEALECMAIMPSWTCIPPQTQTFCRSSVREMVEIFDVYPGKWVPCSALTVHSQEWVREGVFLFTQATGHSYPLTMDRSVLK